MKKFRTKKAVIAISTLTLIFAGRTQLASLSIAKVSDLDFGSAPQGDATKTVAPGVAEDASNASFTVSGQPSTAYTITLPTDGVVTMTTAGGGAANKIINVNGFASFPSAASAGSGLLGVGGTQLLLVGAARDALLAGQTTGSYTGAFTVSVVY
jgi:hypothetical protein